MPRRCCRPNSTWPISTAVACCSSTTSPTLAARSRSLVQLLKDKGADVRSVTIYTKPSTIIQPDYAWKDTDLWINFPWSFQGTVREEDLGLAPSA